MSKPVNYTIDEFREAYRLNKDEADRIFAISGPSLNKLDVFMKVYRRPSVAEHLLAEL